MEQLMHYWPGVVGLITLIGWLFRLENRVTNGERQRLEDKTYYAEKFAELKTGLAEQTKDLRAALDTNRSDTSRQLDGIRNDVVSRIDILGSLTMLNRKVHEIGDRLPN